MRFRAAKSIFRWWGETPGEPLPANIICGSRGRSPHQRRLKRYAFTLVEIMVAIAVFSMVLGSIYSAWMLLMRSTKISKDVAAQAQRQRIALRTIEDSLMAVQSFQASPQYYSFVVENEESPLLSFTARVPEMFPRNGKFINPNTGREFSLRRLAFSLQSASDGTKDLVLRQNPVLTDMDEDEQQFPLVLARNIRKFTIECWDTNKLEWSDEWLNTNAIPTLLRAQLVMGGNTAAGAGAPDVPVTRLFSLPSQMMPAAAQNGSAARAGTGGLISTPGNNAGGVSNPNSPIQVGSPTRPGGRGGGRASGPGITPPIPPTRNN
jgi:prepilin-type N-terminal cleavage/methylation domain-containing protein